MAARHFPSSVNPRTRSPFLLCILALLALSLIFYFLSLFSSPSRTIPIQTSQLPHRNPKVDYSFAASLERFLTNSRRSLSVSDDTVGTVSEEDVRNLDDLIWRRETTRLHEDSLYPAFSPSFSSALRVYVYEMPAKFTYELLWLFRNTYRDTSNLTSNGSPVHRLIEQHSIDYWLWADLIAPESERLLKNVKRVPRQEDADLFYIPFFTTISFFLLEKQQCKALYRVKL